MSGSEPLSQLSTPLAMPRVCVTCRYLEFVEEGQAVPGLLDTTFARFRCQQYGLETTEMTHFPALHTEPLELPLHAEEPTCPGWAPWQAPE